jgi:large subunit ribosomal protein L18
MNETINKLKLTRRTQRKLRTAGSVRGSTERPRLSVFRSVKNILAQIIDDTTGKTLASASSVTKEAKASLKHGGNTKAAAEIGKAIAEKAKEKGITQVAFDRSGYKYHGRVKALADAAREAGLKF